MDRGLLYLLLLSFYLILLFQVPKKIRKLQRYYAPSKIEYPNEFSIDISFVWQPNTPALQEADSSFWLQNQYSQQELTIDSTQLIYQLQDQLCKPQSFGYSVEQGNIKFPKFQYPNCTSYFNGPSPNIKLDQNKLQTSCQNSVLISDISLERKVIQLDNVQDYFEHRQFGSKTNIRENQEIFITKCQNSDQYQVKYKPVYNPLLQKKVNQPRLVLNIVCDSFSRRHFYRMLPETIKLLQQLTNLTVIDFKLHNIKGANSVKNMIPMLGIRNFNKTSEDKLGQSSLYHQFSLQDYITFFGIEMCDKTFTKELGMQPTIDYVSQSFYCAASHYLDYKQDKSSVGQRRCIGDKMSHWYMMDYFKQLLQYYPNQSFWNYMHMDAAHEETGLHARTLDEDLQQFLRFIIEEYSNSHQLIIFLQADHGMRYGNWYNDLQAFQETKLPALFAIISDSYLNQIQNSRQNLWKNSFRLVSKLDLRATQLGILGITRDNSIYPKQGIDLIQEEIPGNRTCESAGIKNIRCSCNELVEMDLGLLDSE